MTDITIEARLAALERENLDFKRRLAMLEGQFEFIVGQLRTLQIYMHDRFEQVDARFDQVAKDIAALRSELRGEIGTLRADLTATRNELRNDMAALRNDLPTIVGDVMREVLREHR